MKPENKENIEVTSKSNIIDLNIGGIEKTKIRINGDNRLILELNLSDLNIAERLEKGYQKLQENITKISGIDSEADDFTEKIHEIDEDMREVVDYIFDSNVSEVCCSSGTMFDLKDGAYKFENILEALTKLYSDNLNSEYKAMKRRVQQHADKYLPQDHKKSISVKRRERVQKEE